MKKFFVVLFTVLSINAMAAGKLKVVTHFPDLGVKKVAFTFDACQTRTPSYFDQSILKYIVANKIPVSIFLSGRFAIQNKAEVKYLAHKYPFIEFENHSMNHNNHMDQMSDAQVIKEIADDEKLVAQLTGRKPQFFRFPAGNYSQHDLQLVNSQGLKVVHWTYASGDPDKHFTAGILEKEIGDLTKPGDILIFHINGRGWNTGKALPNIVKELKAKGYTFVRLEDVLG